MHVERVVFERVFDLGCWGGDFSFESAGRATYAVTLPGRAVPQAGQAWIVAFAKPGDWSTVLGFHDPASGRVKLRVRPTWLQWSSVDLALSVLAVGAVGTIAARSPVGAVAMLAALGCMTWASLIRPRQAVRRALLERSAG